MCGVEIVGDLRQRASFKDLAMTTEADVRGEKNVIRKVLENGASVKRRASLGDIERLKLRGLVEM